MTPYAGEFERYRRLLLGAVAQVDDAAFFAPHGEDGNSLAVIVKHLAGNLASRFTNFLDEDGEKPWRRREDEFDVTGATRAELLAALDASFVILTDTLNALGPSDRERHVTIRGVDFTVDEALARAVAHVAYHVGGAVAIARHAVGDAWCSLSIPRGGTASYNANPTREKLPPPAS